MLVTFNPMINTGSSVDAAYMNFLRCVRAIATAGAGTSSLTVNPFTNNTGTIDGTRNCIVSIDANAEAGGWTESASSNVIQSGSFTLIGSAAAGLYKFDAYTASGKGSLPYLKMTFCDTTQTASSGSMYGNGAHYGGVHSQFATYPFMEFTFGASTTTDWTDTAYRPSTSGYPNYTGQTLSWTMNGFHSNSSNTPSTTVPMFWVNNPTVNYKMAVTANYCIIWEVHTSNSYITNFSNVFATVPGQHQASISYGGLMYGGLRETQAWENSRSDNPPWVTVQAFHRIASPSSGTGNPTPANNVCAYMATINDSGVPSATSTKYFSSDTFDSSTTVFGLTNSPINQNNIGSGIGAGSQALNQGLSVPLWYGRDNGMTSLTVTNQLYMPAVDTTTGTGVPSAFPIMIRRVASGTWNPGGAIRGLYKSLSMPIDTMKNYFANGQTFTIYNSITATSDTYIPIVFHNTMYLVRYA